MEELCCSIYVNINDAEQNPMLKENIGNIKEFINNLINKKHCWTYNAYLSEYMCQFNDHVELKLYTNPVTTLVINDKHLPQMLRIESDDDNWSIIDTLAEKILEENQVNIVKSYAKVLKDYMK